MDINSWGFAQWFTCGTLSLAAMVILMYVLWFLWINRDLLRYERKKRKAERARKKKWKESGVCPEWADYRKFQATRLEEEE